MSLTGINLAFAIMTALYLACFALSALYWHVVHPALATRIRFELFRQRDRLRKEAIEGNIDAQSFCYDHLERLFCSGVYNSGLTVFQLNSEITAARDNISETVVRFREEASPKERDLQNRAIILVWLYACLNISPLWWVIAIMVILKDWIGEQMGRLTESALIRLEETECKRDHLGVSSRTPI
ncbi:MAG: hypothetical protein ACLFWL_12650 [Candidatus Brocadiia bacterium]